MGAMPLYLAIIVARANAYSCASATLHLSSTVSKYCENLMHVASSIGKLQVLKI